MADKFNPPSIDWSTTSDVHKKFKLFKQKCELIFEGPLATTAEEKKVRLLLLWVGDKGLEIYNTANFTEEADRLKLDKVFEKLEAYTKPQSNQILARFQLRCLKQENTPLEEFVTKARLLIEDGGYAPAVRDETLRDTLVFGLKSDQVRKEAIKLGNKLTFKDVYDLAKIEESARVQMEAISQGDNTVHSVRSKHRSASFKPFNKPDTKQKKYNKEWRSSKESKPRNFKIKYKGCLRCGGNHHKSETCPAKSAKCRNCGLSGHFAKVCMKKRLQQLHEIVDSPEYQGEEIHLERNSGTDGTYSAFNIEEVGADDTEPVTVIIGSVTEANTVHDISKFPEKIFATVKLNDHQDIKLKIDTGADTCILTTDDLQDLPFTPEIKPSFATLKGYGGSKIENVGVVYMKISHGNKTINTKFNVVNAPPGSPSMIGCRQAQELGLITVNIDNVASKERPKDSNQPPRSNIDQQPTLSEAQVLTDYKDCFDKIGRFPGEKYHIQLRENPTPVIHPPRSVPVHILPLYKAELEKMKADNIISEVTEPTDWVNSITCRVTKTKDGQTKVRLCLDPKDLNKNIKREHFPTRTIDEILPKLHGKKYFSIIDTKKGYWHQELDYESSLLCTFNSPFGRYKFNCLPFGLVVSQDVFQRKLDSIFQGIPNVSGIADDIIIFGATPEEHDRAFVQVMEAAREHNIGFNSEKLQFKQKKVNFYGHTITEQGLLPSDDKLQAIKDIQPPNNVKELQALLGLITYLNRFSTILAKLAVPLRELTKKNTHFNWLHHHQEALDRIKQELCTAQLISYYDPDPSTTTILQCDASTLGLGAWIRQIDSQGQEKIVGMASRCLTPTETRYSNIERECLAVVYGLEKFEYYLLGRQVIVESDHSPLEQIFKKSLAETPSRLQRFILRCLKFDIQVKYKPGKSIPVADALSRICFPTNNTSNTLQEPEVHFIAATISPLDINMIKEAAASDPHMNLLKETIFKGWPEYRKQCPQELWDYWTFRCELVLDNGLILKGDRIVIPESLRSNILNIIHTGHQGETKCMLLARESVFWPGITKDIRQMVKECDICSKFQPNQEKLPALQPDLPTHPWEQLGTDIFEFKDQQYLIIVDYFSRFPVIRLLQNTTAETVCTNFKSVFAEHGLPSTIIADCGPQYISEKFKRHCDMSNITLKFSSPYHHQANSLAERTVGTVKKLWKKALEEGSCPYTALWMYRVTPLDNNLPSPYELLHGRKPKSLLPKAKKALQSQHPENEYHQEANMLKQEKQTTFYNKHTGTDKRVLNNLEPVYVRNTLKNIWEPATILNRPNPVREPRTYLVNINSKIYQRTREHIKPRSDTLAKEPDVFSSRFQQGAHSFELPAPFSNTSSQSTTSPPTARHTSPRKDTSPQKLPCNDTKALASGDTTEHCKKSVITVKEGKGTFEIKDHTTRTGRTTRVPAKFKQ